MQPPSDRRTVRLQPVGRPSRGFLPAAAGALLAVLAGAALAAEVPDGLRRCAAMPDELPRLACYDAEIARLDGSTDGVVPGDPAGSASVAEAAKAGSATGGAPADPDRAEGDAVDRFGRRGDLQMQVRVEPSEVSSSVAALARGVDGKFAVTLQNGQVWREIAPNPAVRLKTGDPVRIERGALGSFVLIAPNKRSTKVTRLE